MSWLRLLLRRLRLSTIRQLYETALDLMMRPCSF